MAYLSPCNNMLFVSHLTYLYQSILRFCARNSLAYQDLHMSWSCSHIRIPSVAGEYNKQLLRSYDAQVILGRCNRNSILMIIFIAQPKSVTNVMARMLRATQE